MAFLWTLKKRGYKESTISQNYAKILKHLARYSNLQDPESVTGYIANLNVAESRKEVLVDVYAGYCRWKGVSFAKPRYRRENALPYVPLEKDVEALIAALPKKTRTLTRMIYETGARPGEVWNIKWMDINFQSRAVAINKPEKHSRARILRVSCQLTGLLSALPRRNEFVFKKHPGARLDSLAAWFMRKRKQIAAELCNPDINRITWKSLRHFRATMEYARTKDILHVKEMLGHVSINSTLVYTHLVNFPSDEYVCRATDSLEEATRLVENGFDYVTDVEGLKLFRKRK